MSPSPPDLVPLLILNGSVGAGKTTIGSAISAVLASAEVPHAFVDRDALCASWPHRGRFNDVVANLNLASVWTNFRANGAERLIVAGVMESASDVEAVRRAVPGAAVIVCRIRASDAVRETRLRGREHGTGLEWHLARSVELEAILDDALVDDFSIANDGRSPDVVAREVLARLGWPTRSASTMARAP